MVSSSRHLVKPIDLRTFLPLTLALCRSPVIEGSVVYLYAPDFLSNGSTRVPLAAPGITLSPSKSICRSTLSLKMGN